MSISLGQVKKTLAAVGVLITTVSAALADGKITLTEGISIAGAALGVAGVFGLKNAPWALKLETAITPLVPTGAPQVVGQGQGIAAPSTQSDPTVPDLSQPAPELHTGQV